LNLNGLFKIIINKEYTEKELENHPEVLAEAIQTILRKNGIKDSYEIMKSITRGKEISFDSLMKIIENISISKEDKARLLKLRVKDYIGESKEIVKTISEDID